MSTDLVPSNSRRTPPTKPPEWPNAKTGRCFVLLFQSLILKGIHATTGMAKLLNIPLRLFTIATEVKERNYYRIPFQATAFAALFLPHGLLASVIVDCVSEVENIYSSIYSPKKSPPPKEKTLTKEEALEVLALSAQDLTLESLEAKYKELIEDFKGRQSRLSSYFAGRIGKLIDKITLAYTTLKKELQPAPSVG